MNKDFQIWRDQKSDMHENKIRAHFHECEIWSWPLSVTSAKFIKSATRNKNNIFRFPYYSLIRFPNYLGSVAGLTGATTRFSGNLK